ncbi:MAG: YqeG family HAD IIIA-type phosphatase [Thermotogota bacterium]|nr:YqeG family HAD IIIA-type phosphatase [Thermotogota bacterium]
MNRIRDILSLPSPREYYPSIYDIDFQRLKRLGINTLLFDYDNTLAPWKSISVGKDTIALFEKLLNKRFKVCVVTNAPANRAGDLLDYFGGKVPVFGQMKKPGIKKLSKVLEFLHSYPQETALTGDLFFTDIIAGNRMKMYTILVNPYSHYTKEVSDFIGKAAYKMTRWSYLLYFYTIGWFFRLSYLISPQARVTKWQDVDFDKYWEQGYRTIIFDMDNTLARWKEKDLSQDSIDKMKELVAKGYQLFIMSNTRHVERLRLISQKVGPGMKAFGKVKKPFLTKAKAIMKRESLKNSETLFIGDQLFTDILTGNLLKTYTIKVNPIDLDHEFPVTKFLRKLERIFDRKKEGRKKGEEKKEQ